MTPQSVGIRSEPNLGIETRRKLIVRRATKPMSKFTKPQPHEIYARSSALIIDQRPDRPRLARLGNQPRFVKDYSAPLVAKPRTCATVNVGEWQSNARQLSLAGHPARHYAQPLQAVVTDPGRTASRYYRPRTASARSSAASACCSACDRTFRACSSRASAFWSAVPRVASA